MKAEFLAGAVVLFILLLIAIPDTAPTRFDLVSSETFDVTEIQISKDGQQLLLIGSEGGAFQFSLPPNHLIEAFNLPQEISDPPKEIDHRTLIIDKILVTKGSTGYDADLIASFGRYDAEMSQPRRKELARLGFAPSAGPFPASEPDACADAASCSLEQAQYLTWAVKVKGEKLATPPQWRDASLTFGPLWLYGVPVETLLPEDEAASKQRTYQLLAPLIAIKSFLSTIFWSIFFILLAIFTGESPIPSG